MQWALPPKNFHFPSRAQESVNSPITDHGKARKAGRFLKADAVPSVFFFLPATWSLGDVRRSPMEWAWTTKQRKARPWEKACSWLLLAKWWNYSLSEIWWNTRGCSASEVKFGEELDKFKCLEAKCREKPWKVRARTYFDFLLLWSKVRAANTRCRPTCDVGQHAVCIQTGLQKK